MLPFGARESVLSVGANDLPERLGSVQGAGDAVSEGRCRRPSRPLARSPPGGGYNTGPLRGRICSSCRL